MSFNSAELPAGWFRSLIHGLIIRSGLTPERNRLEPSGYIRTKTSSFCGESRHRERIAGGAIYPKRSATAVLAETTFVLRLTCRTTK
ncbi:hypothetical protein A0H81_00972 [Grifola frondosa]|uniref:Uncharacterized protein n=1 Tax=Grifola frondosa TaxID=5627 RepID=A0A1C7MNS6_GRIFR|nr:hypothetical protein A0H81_00972 [Grifola frondosa]